jgi:hypothetical protein
VVEVAKEVVEEELFCGAEVAAGSVGWGKSRGPASLTGAVGRLSVQEGRGDEALLLAWSDSSGWLIGNVQRWVKQWEGNAKWAMASLVISGAVVRGDQPTWAATTGGHRRRALSAR